MTNISTPSFNENDLSATEIYDNAKLFYYLRPDEELKIGRLQFASPGEIEVITKLAELVPALKDVIVVMFAASVAARFIRQLPSMYRQWVQERIAVRQLQREDEKRRLIHEFFVQTMRQHIQPNVFGDDTVRVTNAINLLSNSIDQVASQRVAEPVNLTSRLLGALASLERLFNNGKLAMPRPENGSEGSNASKAEK